MATYLPASFVGNEIETDFNSGKQIWKVVKKIRECCSESMNPPGGYTEAVAVYECTMTEGYTPSLPADPILKLRLQVPNILHGEYLSEDRSCYEVLAAAGESFALKLKVAALEALTAVNCSVTVQFLDISRIHNQMNPTGQFRPVQCTTSSRQRCQANPCTKFGGLQEWKTRRRTWRMRSHV